MISTEQIDDLLSRRTDVIGQDGEKLGTLGRIYMDDRTNVPNFATMNSGLFGMKEHLFPLSEARISTDGLRIPFTKEVVKGAPAIVIDGHLSEHDEKSLYDYYSQARLGAGSPDETPRKDSPDALSVPSPSTREETLSPEYPDAAHGGLRKYVVSEPAPGGSSEDFQQQVDRPGRHATNPEEEPRLSAEGMPEPGNTPEDELVSGEEGPESRPPHGEEPQR